MGWGIGSSARAAASPRGLGRPLAALAAGFVLAVSLGAAWVVWALVGDHDLGFLRADFEYRVRDAERRIEQRMAAQEQVLRGAAGLFTGTRQVERSEFRDYVASLHIEEHHPGIQGVGISLLVPADALASHLRAIRQQGFPAYAIWPPGRRDCYSPIVFIEPFSVRNRRAVGFDMLSEPVRRAAMERARDEGLAALTGMVMLVQESETDLLAGILLYQPIYGAGLAPRSVSERRDRLVGWAFMPFRVDDLMRGLFGERGPELAAHIFDGAATTRGALLFDSEGNSGEGEPGPGHLVARRTLTVAGRTWTLLVQALPAFEARLANSTQPLVAFGGLALGLLLSAMTWVLARGRDRAVGLARVMNRDLRETHLALQVTERRFRTMADGAPVLIWMAGLDKGCTWFNRQWLEFTGRSMDQERGAGWTDGVHPDDLRRCLDIYAAHFDRRQPFTMEYRLRRHDGQHRWFLDSGTPLLDETGAFAGFIGSCVDIDDGKRAESERQDLLAGLARAERAAAVGTLVAGMAHELNNPLTPVLAGLGFVRDRLRVLPEPCLAAWRSSAGASLEEVEEVLDEASRGAGQVRDVVADLRSCALGQHAVDARCDLASVIDRAVRVASHAVTYGTCVAVDLPPLPPVSGSATELLQLFVCLLVNAEQSQGEQPNQVRITAERQGPSVMARIIDTGRGISAANLPRVFDPFFTTRMVGQGRGLGLGVARGIARGLGGDVEVESVEGKGTTVTVTWPVAGGT